MKSSEAEVLPLFEMVMLACGFLFFGSVLDYVVTKKRMGSWSWDLKGNFVKRLLTSICIMTLFAMGMVYLQKTQDLRSCSLAIKVVGTLGSIWILGFSITHPVMALFVRFFNKKESSYEIRASSFAHSPQSRNLSKELQKPKEVPIGIRFETGQIETLSEESRCSHTLILGATGSGKSTLMFNMVLHAIRHKQPILVIDPKSENDSLDSFLKVARQIDPDVMSRFKLFSFLDPDNSCTYNPLKNGTSIQKKDRILEALEWSEPFYRSYAANFLSILLPAMDAIGMTITLRVLKNMLFHKEHQSQLLKDLVQKSAEGHVECKHLFEMLEPFFKKKSNDLLGLAAQISVLDNAEFGKLFAPCPGRDEIDLRSVLEENHIAYFQLNTLSTGDSARRVGRMIVEDLKALASHVYQHVPEKQRKFFPIFIDEFGAFASKEFIECLKQVRGARFAMHLFCQGLEDLDAVSPEFRRQAASNVRQIVALRLSDNETVNEVASIIGTFDTQIRSSQTLKVGPFASYTGAGNERIGKEMVVEHDVFRNLNNLEAVLIKKSPSEVQPIKIFFSSDLLSK